MAKFFRLDESSNASLGVALSAFNLGIIGNNKKMSVECAFQDWFINRLAKSTVMPA